MKKMFLALLVVLLVALLLIPGAVFPWHDTATLQTGGHDAVVAYIDTMLVEGSYSRPEYVPVYRHDWLDPA